MNNYYENDNFSFHLYYFFINPNQLPYMMIEYIIDWIKCHIFINCHSVD